MNILFDQGTPVALRRHLSEYIVTTSYEQGWSNLVNDRLLEVAEQAGYDLLITTDQNLRYQQNLVRRQIAIIVLRSTSWPRIQKHIPAIRIAIERVVAHTRKSISSLFSTRC